MCEEIVHRSQYGKATLSLGQYKDVCIDLGMPGGIVGRELQELCICQHTHSSMNTQYASVFR